MQAVFWFLEHFSTLERALSVENGVNFGLAIATTTVLTTRAVRKKYSRKATSPGSPLNSRILIVLMRKMTFIMGPDSSQKLRARLSLG
jgi:hypothetical protein